MTRKHKLEEVEQFLRNGKLPDQHPGEMRRHVWQQVVRAQRRRRRGRSLLRVPPWLWALASIVLIVLFFVVMFVLR